jgi:DENN (AEX-3) domain/uDENN domain
MNNQVRQRFSRRVADYFLVVGASETLEVTHIEESSPLLKKPVVEEPKKAYEASIVSRYPLTDWPEFPLPEGIPLFCLPNGLILSESRSPVFHSFVHTSDDGTRVLGSCLTVYEPLTSSQRSSISHSSLFYETTTEIEATVSENDALNCVGGEDCGAINGASIQVPETLCVPLCICLISHLPFVQSFKTFLCELYRISLVHPMQIPVERYVCNFIDEVPSPPAGRVDVTYFIGDRSITFRCPPSNQPNVWSGMPLFPIFECLSPENVLMVFSLALIERQIIFVSSQYSLLTSCAEAITSLLYPLSWTHAYIPILPRELLGNHNIYTDGRIDAKRRITHE